MIRKTFTTKPDAETFAEHIRQLGGIAIVGILGDKFRVYANNKEDIEKQKQWSFKFDPEYYLRQKAWNSRDEIAHALTLKKSMESGDLYNDYETIIEVARIMYEWHELKTAKDVFEFIDRPNKYDETIKRLIDETLEEHDYEAKEEVGIE